jgi:hypothetical protein
LEVKQVRQIWMRNVQLGLFGSFTGLFVAVPESHQEMRGILEQKVTVNRVCPEFDHI